MHRRELLGAVGLGATGIAGVVGTRATGAQETTTTGTTTAGDGFTGIESESDRPFTTISVGTRAGVSTPESHRPHRVRVWNDSDESRTVGLRLVRDESAVLDRSVEFPADGYLTLRLLEPARYALELRPGGEVGETATTGDAGGAGSGTVEISRARFDCNDSRTDVRVAADGAVQTATTTTNAACPPELTDRTFTAFRGSCGSADDASVSFAEESVAVDGSIQVPNPCYGARLAEVSVPSADTLRVAVAATEPTAGVCVQCVGTVEYRTTLAFRDRVPETVEVVHRRGDASETVATVTRGAATTTGAS
ncbi:hypothetical protein [Halorussus caseinilyticus]|uniref:hypothetical protein n=1 Tax=Halorussus caseinilyticus TaxID=3034025 RepID=UPI0023E820A3|nr:hypothetical protein [Halorussus sp. DT72]